MTSLPAWSVDLNNPETINALRGEPPLRITIEAEDWAQAKEAWQTMLKMTGEENPDATG